MITIDNDYIKIMIEQYKLAIQARDKLQENYHKWMTFYYVANSALLISITGIINKNIFDNSILFLSMLGILVCIFWNMSCKGYYYWSKNWIHIIMKYENNLFNNNDSLRVYSVFSRRVAEENNSILSPNKPANVSTPKLTLFFSIIAILCWLSYAIYRFLFIQFTGLNIEIKIVIVLFFISVVLVTYLIMLPKYTKSRDDSSHILL